MDNVDIMSGVERRNKVFSMEDVVWIMLEGYAYELCTRDEFVEEDASCDLSDKCWASEDRFAAVSSPRVKRWIDSYIRSGMGS